MSTVSARRPAAPRPAESGLPLLRNGDRMRQRATPSRGVGVE